MNDPYLEALEKTVIDTHKKMLQVQQTLILLIRNGAVDMDKLTLGQRSSVERFLNEWLDEWRRKE